MNERSYDTMSPVLRRSYPVLLFVVQEEKLNKSDTRTFLTRSDSSVRHPGPRDGRRPLRDSESHGHRHGTLLGDAPAAGGGRRERLPPAVLAGSVRGGRVRERGAGDRRDQGDSDRLGQG